MSDSDFGALNPDDAPGVPPMLVDLLRMLTAMVDPEGATPLATDDAQGVIVSTVFTKDLGHETAVLDTVTSRPVERYATKEEALAGHARWLAYMRDERPATITQLGYGWSLEPELQEVQYDAEWSATELPAIKERQRQRVQEPGKEETDA